jgi:hypothetical protein
MTENPVTTLDTRYSGENAKPAPWPEAVARLEKAGLFWVASVRADGRLHVTPVVGVWADGAFYFSSGPGEQKSRNLAASSQCAVITGNNTWDEGFDIVVHGQAAVERDLTRLRTVAGAFLDKYGDAWAFEVADDGTFLNPGHGGTLVYRVAPDQALGFGKGDPFSQTRWDFGGLG